jgi:hypothetical protein
MCSRDDDKFTSGVLAQCRVPRETLYNSKGLRKSTRGGERREEAV